MQAHTLRDYVGKTLARLYTDRMYVIDADLSKATSTADFQKEHPSHFIEAGISEGSGVSMATGLAMEGMIPFYVNFALFCTGSAWTQLRQACYARANIKLIGTHPGLDNGPDGPTHHGCEDIALALAIPGLHVLVPASLEELESALRLAIASHGPVYIRAARSPLPDVPMGEPFQLGKAAVVLDEGGDYAILYEGASAAIAWEAAASLKDLGALGKLVNMRCLKPLDAERVLWAGANAKVVVTVENHSVMGGLNSAVAQVLARQKSHAPLRAVAVMDTFTESGPAKDVKAAFGLTAQAVVRACLEGKELS